MEEAQVPRQSPRLSPRAVSTGSCCRRLLASGILFRRKQEVRAVTWADQRPAVSVSLAGASRGPAGAGSRCSPNTANQRRSFPAAQPGLEPWKNLQTTLAFRCLATELHGGVCSGGKNWNRRLFFLYYFFSCHPEVGEDRVFKN